MNHRPHRCRRRNNSTDKWHFGRVFRISFDCIMTFSWHFFVTLLHLLASPVGLLPSQNELSFTTSSSTFLLRSDEKPNNNNENCLHHNRNAADFSLIHFLWTRGNEVRECLLYVRTYKKCLQVFPIGGWIMYLQ